jgi:hypothetical protein
MTAGRLPRRLIVGTTSAALLAGAVGFVPLLGSASAAACPSWTDPADDSGVITPLGTDPSGMSADSDLDIVSTTVSFASDGAMTVVVKVKGLKDVGPDASAGDEFVINSSVAGTATKVTLARDTFISGSETAKLAAAASVVGTAKFDVAASTVTGTFTGALVKTAFGKDIAGLKMDGFETLAYGYTLTPAGPHAHAGRAVRPAAQGLRAVQGRHRRRPARPGRCRPGGRARRHPGQPQVARRPAAGLRGPRGPVGGAVPAVQRPALQRRPDRRRQGRGAQRAR